MLCATDDEFYTGQAAFELPRGINPDFDMYRLYTGCVERSEPMHVGRLPAFAQRRLGWRTDKVYLSCTFAQHVRCENGLPFGVFALVMKTVTDGDVYAQPHRGPHGSSVAFVLQLDDARWAFLPCQIDRGGNGIFARTFWCGQVSAANWKRLRILVSRSCEMIRAA